jgi:hypothetical protein
MHLTRTTTEVFHGLASAFVLTVVIMAAPTTLSAEEPPGPAALEVPADDSTWLERFEYWRARGDSALERLDKAESELAAVNGAVSRMRRRNHPRGPERIAMREEQARAQKVYEVARHHFEVELPAEARGAGVPRKWVGRPR